MTDIVERLRGLHVKRHPSRSVVECDETTILEAADRIEKLEAALREAATSLDQAANEMCDCRKAGTKRVCRGAHYEQAAKDARALGEKQ